MDAGPEEEIIEDDVNVLIDGFFIAILKVSDVFCVNSCDNFLP